LPGSLFLRKIEPSIGAIVRYGLLDVSRLIAAAMVVIFHASFFTGHKLAGGALIVGYHGVDFFFVLSGFVILTAHRDDLGQPARLPNYVLRRFLRIFPPYWLALGIAVALIPITGGVKPLDVVKLVRDVFLIPTSVQDYPYVTPAWTLHYELMFYLAFCLLLMVRPLFGALLFAAWGVAIVVLERSHVPMTFPASFILNPIIVMFLSGMVAALLHRRLSARAGLVIAAISAAWFFGYGIGRSVDRWLAWCPYYISFGIPAAFMVAGLAAFENKRGSLISSKTEFLGKLSYSTYLAHAPVMPLVRMLLPELSPALLCVAMVVAGMMSGLLFYVLLEQPTMRVLRSWIYPAPARLNSRPATV
jgi:exopolysaccharide production protein ExoZ